jgi:hypothetical protein
MHTPKLRIVLLPLLLALPSVPQDLGSLVGEWQPVTVGDRWLYVREMRTGTREQPRIETREQNEVITTSLTYPPGTLILRRVENRPNADVNILIRNNCIFFPGEHYYDVSLPQIAADSLPDVCFPLREGMTWGDPKKGRDLWTVAGLGKKHPDDPSSVTPDSWRLEAHLASGDDNYVWFRKGVGVVAARTWHNGTYTDETVRLVRFEPAH